MRYKIVDRSGVESNSDDTFEDVADVVTRGTSVSNQESKEEEKREESIVREAIAIITILVLINVMLLGCLGALVYIGGYTSLLSPSLLAFSFGIRHAVDADHIAAIDNVTRKLIRDGRKPLTVGLWFSLGHSTIVVILCIVIAAGSTYARDHLDSASSVGSIVGTIVSATVLLLIGSLNLYTAYQLWVQWARIRNGNVPRTIIQQQENGGGATMHSHDGGLTYHTHLVDVTPEAEVEGLDGFLTRCCPNIFRSVDRAWKMYPIGCLFGLGFDTASEVGLLALAASTPSYSKHGSHVRSVPHSHTHTQQRNVSKHQVPAWATIVMPLLFASGMSLLDTLDGMLMLWSYSWAQLHPERKIFFNFYLTILSGLIAMVVGLIETLGCFQNNLDLHGTFWNAIGAINDHFEIVGYSIVGLFVVSTLFAIVYFKFCLVVEAGNDDDDEPAESMSLKDPLLPLVRDKYAKLSSVQLVKYIRENATNEFLETRDLTSLLRGRLRDVARLLSHKRLAKLCREIDGLDDEYETKSYGSF